MSTVPDYATFVEAYKGQPPWEIGRPQPAVLRHEDQIRGSILDCGCGTGLQAVHFAQLGNAVTGIDFVAEAIALARRRAEQAGVAVRFEVADARELVDGNERFDCVLDCGLWHVFDDADRARYMAGLAHVVKPGGRVFVHVFSTLEPGTHGPRRVAESELRAAFAQGWEIETLEPCRYESRTDHPAFRFSSGGAHAWFLIARRAPEGT